jgi:hypothetical protein
MGTERLIPRQTEHQIWKVQSLPKLRKSGGRSQVLVIRALLSYESIATQPCRAPAS